MYSITAEDAAELRSHHDPGTPDEDIAAQAADWDENVVYYGKAFTLVDSLPGVELLALVHELAEGHVIPSDFGDFACMVAWHVIYRRTLAALADVPA